MPFVRINGWAIPLVEGSASERRHIGGDFDRAYDGSSLADERFDKRRWSGRTPPVTEAVGLAIQGLVNGAGHSWPFDADLYSSKGLSPGNTVGSLRLGVGVDGAQVVDFSSGVSESKFGNSSLAVEPATTNLLTSNQATATDTSGNTTGFTVIGGATLTSDTTHKAQGSRSLKVDCAAIFDGGKVSFAVTAGLTYTIQILIKPTDTRTIEILARGNVSGNFGATATVSAGKWYRYYRTFTAGAGNTSFDFEFYNRTSSAGIFYADCLMAAQQDFAATWTDGSYSAGNLAYDASRFHSARDLTITGWVRIGTVDVAAHRYVGALGRSEGLALADNYILLRRSNGANDLHLEVAGATASSALTYMPGSVWSGAWRWLAAALRASPEAGENALSLYVDGALVASAASLAAGALPDFSQANTLHVGHLNTFSRLGADGLIDDLHVLPYAAPASLISAWYAQTKSLALLPRVYLDGDAIGGTFLAEGQSEVSRYVAAHSGGAFRTNLRVLDLEMVEA